MHSEIFLRTFDHPAVALSCLDPAGKRTCLAVQSLWRGEWQLYKSAVILNQMLEERKDIEVY